ncbi:tRNA-modifying protein YgfZ [Biostraticola tofi]|uniref:tRNA-modifying protein YgfZ n=1 Tax=Biostraticola tofi TaxID=466109 RepID=A0A4V2W3E9_9GAMM|nr:tRNA-modifying protein YgfZ [Biostraticola tofi]TCV91709.1 hypothetical protein EDC52_11530 [Biostraticola tofi]
MSSPVAIESGLPKPAAELPLTLISLDDWALVTASGAEAVKYLQGQLTCDVAAIGDHQHVIAAHCDAKGKMWSTLRLFHHQGAMAYIERRALRETQLTEIKKYAVFSKITFTADDNHLLIGVAGQQARQALREVFQTLPDALNQVVEQQDTTLLHFSHPAERFLLVTTPARLETLQAALAGKAAEADSRQWLALDIEAGLPVIDSVNSVQFIPQATNLQALEGISFSKGCYAGQEMVARAKYRGANKRALYWLAGTAHRLPEAGEDLELQLGENWRRTGTILAACRLADDRVWLQAVLNNDLEAGSRLRVKDDVAGALTIQPLPYLLD